MSEGKKYGGPDRFRMIAAILVIAIHTSPLASFSGNADFFLTRILARIAVPFFFMVTGQFIMTDYLYDNDMASGRLFQYIRKTALVYGLAVMIYVPVGIYAGHYKGLNIISAIRMIVFDGTFYHLWYFPACITGVLLVYLMSRCMGRKGMMAIAAALYAVGLFGDSYYGLIKDVPVLSVMYEFMFQLFSYTRNGFFFAPVFLISGALIGRKNHVGKKPSRILRNIAMWMYILHPAVIVAVRGGARVIHMTALFVDNSLVHYFTVTFLSGLWASAISCLISRRRKINPTGRAWIEIDRSALRNNAAFLRSKLPKQCRLMPAVKADAYGHGAVLIAKELNRIGVDAFCVACALEGVKLRKKGVKGEILVLGYTHPEEFFLLYRYRLTQTVIDYAYGVQLNEYGRRLHVHIGIDTGMHRLGERSENIDFICKFYHMENLKIDGLFTHLCAADSFGRKEQAYTNLQAEEFYKVVHELQKRGYSCPKLHLQSSYSILNYPELAENYARAGIALYGVLSTEEDTEEWKELKPVLSLKARIAAVKNLYAGESAGYGLGFTAGHNMKIAVVAIGYGDGYPRSLSGGIGTVLINGCKASVIGCICMDQTIVDVSGIPDVKAGDEAVLIGKSGEAEISVCDIAKQAGTITNEVLSRLGARLERIVM